MMRIIRIDKAAFGTLNITTPVEFDPGLNILTAPNQAGKSTLLTLVEWLLYGVPARGQKRNQAEVTRWQPWDGSRAAATVVVEPGRPDWPVQVIISVDFEEFTPQVTDAGTLAAVDPALYTVDRNGTWDIGRRLTGLGREAFRLSLLAPQEEMDTILHDVELRRLLTADLADLVEDPERATLDGALALLERPSFTLGELSKGPVQMGKLLREATREWQLAAGDLDSQQERYQHLEKELAQCEQAETELGELNLKVHRLEQHLVSMDLAAARWRFDQVDRLEQQGVDWQQRVESEPWLRGFPAELQREVDTWIADRRNLQEQLATAEARSRDAEALRLRAPYVDKVNVEGLEEVARSQEKLRVLRNDILTQSGRLCDSKDTVERIDAYLSKHQDKEDYLGQVKALGAQVSAIRAADGDREKADALVKQYGDDRDAEERLRLEELDAVVKPFRGCVPQIADYIEWTARLETDRAQREQERAALEATVKAAGQPLLIGGIIAAVVGIAAALVGHFAGVYPAWIGYAAGAVLLVLGIWLVVSGLQRGAKSRQAAAELKDRVEPALAEIAGREAKCRAQAVRVQTENSLDDLAWQKLLEVVPEYQKLRLSLEQYAQALRDREGALDRRRGAWEAAREAYPLCGDEVDADWLEGQISILEEFKRHTQRRLDEHSKLRDAENRLESAKRDEAEILGRLKAEFTPLGLADTLKKDVDGAVSQFRKMVADARQWQELQRDAAEGERLKVRQRDLNQKLSRLLAPLGLGDLAAGDQDSALREYEVRRDEARRFSEYDERLADAREQLRHLGIERGELEARWQALAPEVREKIATAVTDEAGYDALVAKRRESGETLENLRRNVDQKRAQVDKLRQSVARDEDVRDALERASLRQYETRDRLDRVRIWQRALELTQQSLTQIQHQLAGNLAPRLTEELRAVLKDAPVRHITAVGLDGQLELQLSVSGAPAGLSAAELIDRLSVGARRQLALGLRVAVARALGEEGGTVLLLDEPLAELDDTRAVGCLRYIGQLASDHQVLLTTCHAEHQAWLERESGVVAHTVSLG